MVKTQTLKGFRDFLPSEVKKREYILNTLKKVFESYGFEPLETPSLEYEGVLTGKYGNEGEKLMYKFKDLGDRNVALRYDQTVPLARVVSQYQNELPMPFKRYQIQNVWRAENTQKGRYREFLQVDADIVGTYSPLADAEIIQIAYKSLEALGFKEFKFFINDRNIFQGISSEKIREIDKVNKEIDNDARKKLTNELISKYPEMSIIIDAKKTDKIEGVLSILKLMNISEPQIQFMPTLARGLDYYTGIIFEVEIKNYDAGSIAGGGRYDNLIGIFAGREIPAIGFSFGFDRLLEAMEQLNLFPKDIGNNSIFVAFSSPDLQQKALELTTRLRNQNISAEFYLEDASLEKQLKYADKKQIPYSIIVSENRITLKNMEKRTQEDLTIEEIIKKLK